MKVKEASDKTGIEAMDSLTVVLRNWNTWLQITPPAIIVCAMTACTVRIVTPVHMAHVSCVTGSLRMDDTSEVLIRFANTTVRTKIVVGSTTLLGIPPFRVTNNGGTQNQSTVRRDRKFHNVNRPTQLIKFRD
jgi:hypothetical protein